MCPVWPASLQLVHYVVIFGSPLGQSQSPTRNNFVSSQTQQQQIWISIAPPEIGCFPITPLGAGPGVIEYRANNQGKSMLNGL